MFIPNHVLRERKSRPGIRLIVSRKQSETCRHFVCYLSQICPAPYWRPDFEHVLIKRNFVWSKRCNNNHQLIVGCSRRLCCVRVSDAVTSYLSDAAAGGSKGYSAMNPYLMSGHQLRPNTRWSPVIDFDASDTEDTGAGAIYERRTIRSSVARL